MFSRAETEFLTSERVARIATINAINKTPHVVPVCFAFNGKEIFTALHVKSKRLKNIEQGSALALLVDAYKEAKSEWQVLRGLLIHGVPRILNYHESKGEFMYGWRLLIQKYPQYKRWANADLTPKDPEKRRIMKIKPKKVIRWGFE